MSIYEITINGAKFVVELGDVSTSPVEVIVNGERKLVAFVEASAPASEPVKPAAAPASATVAAPAPTPQPVPKATPIPVPGEGHPVKAPMPGKVLSITVQVGSVVKEGDTVLTFEAMKMEMPLSSTVSGTVKAIHVQVGDTVAYDDTLMVIG